jgi:hypothetical protein
MVGSCRCLKENLDELRIERVCYERVTLVLFRRRALGEQSGAEQRIGARVRKSRQKEAAGAADAGLMQIEWREGEVERC